MIGTDRTGTRAVPNFEYGVLLNNSVNNTIGGSPGGSFLPTRFLAPTPANLISGNGIAGVVVFGGTAQIAGQSSTKPAAGQGNVIAGNLIGTDAAGNASFNGFNVTPPIFSTSNGYKVYFGLQLHGVVVIGSSNNQIGAGSTTRGSGIPNVGNLIKGNIQTGVYISRRDFTGQIYAIPTSNLVQSNLIATNGIYGVLRYDAPNNPVVAAPYPNLNTLQGDPIPIADYITGFNTPSKLPPPTSILLQSPAKQTPKGSKKSKKHVKPHPKAHAHPKVPVTKHPARKSAPAAARKHAPAPARPKVPALFRPGVKLHPVQHKPSSR